MAGIAGASEFVESDGEFGAALGSDRLSKILDRRINVGLEHLSNRNAIMGRIQLLGGPWHPESLVRETDFETLLMNFGLAPDEGLGLRVVGIDEVVDVLSELFDRGEGFVAQGLSL